ncbi:MAG: serine/threonine-protein kinase [Acidobacteria bacterium]|nr:serine/threonine-protein kinase [Acidobacteriota bacterium]
MTDDPSKAANDATPGHPARFGPYRVDGVIGAGGMGIVYRAYDEALQRPVALKTLLPALTVDPDFVARFKREAQSAAALNHVNITQIYAIGQEGPTPFFAMELIQGESLDVIIKEKGALDPLLAARYMHQAAQGLRHAAQRHLIHRDVKPSNLMLTEEGVVKITDFGLAKVSQSQTQLTATGEILGSPGYISPEQAQGLEIDARADLYSLGATFYHLVTGKLPFEAPTPVAMIVRHMNDPLRPPRAANPTVPYPISALIQRMMAKRPGERFQSYDAFLKELDRAIGASEASATLPAPAGGTVGPGGTGRPEPRGQRPARPAGAPPSVTETPRSSSWMGTALIVILGGLIVTGVVLKSRANGEGDVEASPRTDASLEVSPPFSRSDVTSPQSSGPTDLQSASIDRPGLRALRVQKARRSRSALPPSLKISRHDHEVRADGRLRIFGEVRNTGGGPAHDARVRIKVLDDLDREIARRETPLFPTTIEPYGAAQFEVTFEDAAIFSSISAEVFWSR